MIPYREPLEMYLYVCISSFSRGLKVYSCYLKYHNFNHSFQSMDAMTPLNRGHWSFRHTERQWQVFHHFARTLAATDLRERITFPRWGGLESSAHLLIWSASRFRKMPSPTELCGGQCTCSLVIRLGRSE